MNKEEILNLLIKKLEKDINTYRGEYGSLEDKLSYTLQDILDVLKLLNGKNDLLDFQIERLVEDYGDSNE